MARFRAWCASPLFNSTWARAAISARGGRSGSGKTILSGPFPLSGARPGAPSTCDRPAGGRRRRPGGAGPRRAGREGDAQGYDPRPDRPYSGCGCRSSGPRESDHRVGNVNGHSKFPHLRSSKIPPPPVENNDETSACGRCGQAVCGLSKSLWARLRVHGDGSVHRPPIAHVPAVVGLTTPDFSLSFSRYESPRMLIVVA